MDFEGFIVVSTGLDGISGGASRGLDGLCVVLRGSEAFRDLQGIRGVWRVFDGVR